MTITQERIKISRSLSIDNLRGFAILLMILDHCLLVFHGPFIIRHTLTRIAMPLFFVISGHLLKKVSWRIAGVGVIGIILPMLIPFIDNPNVLFWYAAFSAPVVLAKRFPIALPIVVASALTVAANGYVKLVGDSYDPFSLFALMTLGAMINRASFSFGTVLPNWVGKVGRFPLRFYIVHLFILEALVR